MRPGLRTRRRSVARARADPRGTAAVIRVALAEDRWRHDATTRAVLRRPYRAAGTVTAQARGVVSGVAVAEALARRAGLKVRVRRRDGAWVRPGARVLALEGDARGILAVERTLLNFLMHLSGVATLTARAVAAARNARPGFRIRATRKTLPGLRDLEKQAVVHGGGETHRRDLSEALLIKNNHFALVPVEEAVRRARLRDRTRSLQVEVRTPSEAVAAVRAGARRLLVDNQTPRSLRSLLRTVRRLPGGPSVEVEASGGITPENVADFARAGADAASLGVLTHSAPALPFHLELAPLPPPRRAVGSRSRSA